MSFRTDFSTNLIHDHVTVSPSNVPVFKALRLRLFLGCSVGD